ncbi:TPA: protein translocase subunit SecD [Candidatus Uhrbacteria bacterium]|nr:protein translocase subunit SecD [Candidatus Uhrbacteria bacterium]
MSFRLHLPKLSVSRSARQSFTRVFAIFMLLVVTGLTAFPAPWNTAMGAVKNKIGWSLPNIPDNGFTLGLDLKGGVHLVYEADMSAIPAADRASALNGVRDVIERRANSLGVSESRVETTIADGHYRVIIELPGIQDAAEATKSIGETPVLQFKTPTAKTPTEATPEQQIQIDADQKAQRSAAVDIMNGAIKGDEVAWTYDGFVAADDSFYANLIKTFTRKTRVGVVKGVYENGSTINVVKYMSQGSEETVEASHILVCFAGATKCTQTRTKEEAKTVIDGLKAQATEANFADLAKANSDEPGAATSAGSLGTVKKGMMVQSFEDALFALQDGTISDVVESEFGYHIIYRTSSKKVPTYEFSHFEMPWTTLSDVVNTDPWENTELSGKDIKSASVAFDQQTNAPFISLTFNAEGAELFGKLTAANVGQVIGIFLDGEPVTTPVVNQAIYGGTAQITGNFTLAEAKTTAERLNAGALPVPINVLSQQTIGPTLGQASLDASLKAAFIAFLLISLFMVLYYRLPGFLAIVALLIYSAINLTLYKIFGVTITLSGIAGFVLSVGIAVDANVLIFERLKEELWSGRDLPTAIVEAAKRAWPSIRDGNATTLIATFILFTMGTSFIKGFALTLMIGIFVSLFCAMVITRSLLLAVSRRPSLKKRLFFLGLK